MSSLPFTYSNFTGRSDGKYAYSCTAVHLKIEFCPSILLQFGKNVMNSKGIKKHKT